MASRFYFENHRIVAEWHSSEAPQEFNQSIAFQTKFQNVYEQGHHQKPSG